MSPDGTAAQQTDPRPVEQYVQGEQGADGASKAPRATGPHVSFEPTDPDIVTVMLRLARASERDRLIDLGSGDGRIAIAAARDFGARAVGIEINSRLVALARERARSAGVADLATFVHQDLYAADLGAATIVTLFLLPEANLLLRPKLLAELPAGARIVSHTHGMREWRPEKTRHIRDRAGWHHRIHLWTVPQLWRYEQASAHPREERQ